VLIAYLKIAAVELTDRLKAGPFGNLDQERPKRAKTHFPQSSHDPVNVHRGQAANLRKIGLRKRQLKFAPITASACGEAVVHFAEKMGNPGDGVEPAQPE